MLSVAAMMLAAAEEAGEAHSSGILSDTALWVLIAFVLVIFLFARFGLHKTAASSLDKRGQRIADEINEARKMREEAQELLAQYQRRAREAEDEAAAIIEHAKRDAQRMSEDARKKIADQMERRIAAAEAKIARAEAQALSEVRSQTADLAIAAAGDIIRDRMDAGAQNAFVDKAIAGLRQKLN